MTTTTKLQVHSINWASAEKEMAHPMRRKKKTRQKRVITRKTYDVINRWDDTVLMMQKCTQIKWHSAQIQIERPDTRWALWRHSRTKTLISLIFIYASDITTKTKRRSKRYEETTHALLWFGFFRLHGKITKKHVHICTHTPQQRSWWKIASICERIVHIHHCMGYKYKFKYMCINTHNVRQNQVSPALVHSSVNLYVAKPIPPHFVLALLVLLLVSFSQKLQFNIWFS